MSVGSESEKIRPLSLGSAMRSVGMVESWSLRIIHPELTRSLAICFNVLTSRNGFRKTAETYFIFQEKKNNREIQKVAVKVIDDIRSFSQSATENIQINDCYYSKGNTRGRFQASGYDVAWDFSIANRSDLSWDPLPSYISKAGLLRSTDLVREIDLRVIGTSEIDGISVDWKDAKASRSKLAGTKYFNSWTYCHCSSFLSQSGIPKTLVFEGFTVKPHLFRLVPLPNISSLYCVYEGTSYIFDTVRDFFKFQVVNGFNEWRFRADREELSFRGTIRADHRDFVGHSHEDTDGTFLYSFSSHLADCKIHVYRNGKLEESLFSESGGSIETCSRDKNPYVSLML